MNREVQSIIDNANRDCRTVGSGQIRKLIHHIIGLEKTMAKVAELADTGTAIHKVIFDPYAVGEIPTGWRVAEKMREHLLAVLSFDGRPLATTKCVCGETIDLSPMLNADLELIRDDLANKLGKAEAKIGQLLSGMDEMTKQKSEFFDEIERLRTESRELRADALRYRFLKRNNPLALASVAWRFPNATAYGSDKVDEAVDAAIAQAAESECD